MDRLLRCSSAARGNWDSCEQPHEPANRQERKAAYDNVCDRRGNPGDRIRRTQKNHEQHSGAQRDLYDDRGNDRYCRTFLCKGHLLILSGWDGGAEDSHSRQSSDEEMPRETNDVMAQGSAGGELHEDEDESGT